METQDREVDLIDLGAVSVETRGQLEIAEVDSDNQRFTPEALTAD
ncbi:benenodin family lasso peptide [Brevundimonas diminuta]|uniref:Benenodin family lasso peptide n=1 Tax=Brevundimonas diminuta TaxID=293 RepID=A0A410NZ63_BREDI|nr:benenodin family lasso peptide [Brevundimonas diminuta]MBD3572711.1 benenodin family lasso peptide [Brevundimonas diminuta]MBD3817480.1 benenodin family lasso peptide [Brevundimonas diminuta]QAT15230.1 benenodin family lasso peptide [Brevundimonas diminuta]QQB87386.1 benenodin family lasso peptide [Brevundimonas diminuta]